MYSHLITPEIEDLVKARDFTTVRDVVEDWSPVDLAELVAELSAESRVVVFRLLPKDVASETFSYCELDTQEALIHDMAREDIAQILNDMPPDDRTHLFEDLPANVVFELVNTLNAEERAIAMALLNYPEDSVGRLMTPDYIILKKHWTVRQALDHIRKFGRDSEVLTHLYVTDHGTLVDDIHVRELLLADPDQYIEDIMDYSAESLLATADQETAVLEFRRLDRFALPVVDEDNKLLGIVTVDDVFDVAEEQATEEMQRFGAVEALDEGYMESSILELFRARAVWLVVLFFGGILTAAALTYFESIIDRAVILAILLPMIISNGGNSGSQTATLIVRAMALGEVTLSDWWRIVSREVLIGLMLGIMLGTLGFLRIVVWASIEGTYTGSTLLIGIVVFISLVGIVIAL
jgi:magnesium transporter